MQWPHITAVYLALLALVYAALAINVVRLRSAIRAHAHFAEYVPVITLMVATLEMSGVAAWRVHVLMAALLISRLLHPFGMYAKPGTPAFRIGRVGGMALTIILLITCAAAVLSRV